TLDKTTTVPTADFVLNVEAGPRIGPEKAMPMIQIEWIGVPAKPWPGGNRGDGRRSPRVGRGVEKEQHNVKCQHDADQHANRGAGPGTCGGLWLLGLRGVGLFCDGTHAA